MFVVVGVGAMELVVDSFELWVGYMGIDLGGGYIAVAKEFLDTAQVCAIHE